MTRLRRFIPLLLVLACAAGRPAAAQTDSAAAPPAASAYTTDQAARGRDVFRRVCGNCHVASLFTGPAFRRAWAGRAAFELFEQIRTTMPVDNPGRLPRQEYADVVAYLFSLNGVPAGPVELGTEPEALRRVLIQPAADPRD